MKVKIIKASKPTYWYASRNCEIFEVVWCPAPFGTGKFVTTANGKVLAIDKDDCEVVEQ